MPNLLFLMQRLPYPLIKGEKVRNWHILNYLTKWYDVHFGCLIDDPEDFQHIGTVRSLCASMYTAPLNRERAKLTCARGLLTGEPLSVTFFRDRGLQRWVEDVVTRIKPEMTFVNSSNMAPYILDLPRTGQRVVELGDIDSEKFRSYSETASAPMRQIYRREWRLVEKLERRIALECDYSVLVTEPEAALFRTKVPEAAAKIVGISCGVDHRYFDPSREYPAPFDLAAGPAFVFTGTMDYLPNIDAVTWFATEVLPIIRRTKQAARFFIVGSNPSEDVKRLAKLDGVTVTGRVPDVRPYISHATAAVAPMRIARGIQNKVLEAMAMGKPVIVTSGALEGIDAAPGREVILADDAETFANAAIRLSGGNGVTPEGMALGEAARRLILEHYDWDFCLSGFDALMRPAGTGRSHAPALAAAAS